MTADADRPILVTGGAGFIGSNLVDALLDAGHRVTVVDDLSTGRPSALEGALRRGATLVRASVLDRRALDAAFAAARPTRVFHLAAQIDVRRSMEDPAFDAAVNVLGTVHVLDAACAHGVRRVVNTSTGGAIYGHATLVPTPEVVPERPLAAYGTSKLAAEQYCAWTSRMRDLSVQTLRLANVYGPRQDPRGEAGVIALFCDGVLRGATPTVYGDGSQTRDFVFVGDVVRAQLAAGWSDCTETVNVGTGVETTVLELARIVAVAAGLPALEPVRAPARAGEVHRSCLDARRLRATLGVAPRTSLLEGLRATLSWLRARDAAPAGLSVGDEAGGVRVVPGAGALPPAAPVLPA